MDFTASEKRLLRKLNTPARVQEYLNRIPFNFEKRGETLKSPLRTLRERSAHCFEGALLGAYTLSLHGYPPLILHLESLPRDYDHVVAPFRVRGLWGALSKTNHAVLRSGEPVYRTIRELVMSYFHEYFLDNGAKTLRRYSLPLDLSVFGKSWAADEKDLWKIDKKLDQVKHYQILPKKFEKNLRKADQVEIKAGKIVEYKI